MISTAHLLNDIIVLVRFTRSQIWGHSASVKEKAADSHKRCQLCPWNYILLFDLFQLSQLARAILKNKKNKKKPSSSQDGLLSSALICRKKWSCLCTFHSSFVEWLQKHLLPNIWISLLSTLQRQKIFYVHRHKQIGFCKPHININDYMVSIRDKCTIRIII